MKHQYEQKQKVYALSLERERQELSQWRQAIASPRSNQLLESSRSSSVHERLYNDGARKHRKYWGSDSTVTEFIPDSSNKCKVQGLKIFN